MKRLLGLLFLIVGVAGLVTVYTMRPPTGLGEALLNAVGGRPIIREPHYQMLMGASGLVTFFGAILTVARSRKSRKEK